MKTIKDFVLALIFSYSSDETEVVVHIKDKEYKVKDCYTDINGVFRVIVGVEHE